MGFAAAVRFVVVVIMLTVHSIVRAFCSLCFCSLCFVCLFIRWSVRPPTVRPSVVRSFRLRSVLHTLYIRLLGLPAFKDQFAVDYAGVYPLVASDICAGVRTVCTHARTCTFMLTDM